MVAVFVVTTVSERVNYDWISKRPFPWCSFGTTTSKLTKCAQILGILSKTFKQNLIQKSSRIKVYKALALPFLYGSETKE
jgi:hypothetical protein